MTDLSQSLTDNSDLRRYFAIIEHMADDDLGVYEYRLLGHYKRVCGTNGGQCTESVRETAAKCQMSVGQASKSRRILTREGWIKSTTHSHLSEDGKPVIDGISVTLIDRMAENVARYSEGCSPSEQGVHGVNKGVHPVKQRRTRTKELKEIETPPANAGEVSAPFVVGDTVYALNKAKTDYVDVVVIGLTTKGARLRWTNGTAVKEIWRAFTSLRAEKPVLKTLDDFTPRQQVVMRWTRNVKPGEGIPGETVEFANTVLKQLDIRFGTNGSAPDAAELDAAWSWAKAQGLTYRDPAKIATLVNDYRDTVQPPFTPQAQRFVFNPSTPAHVCNDGMVIDHAGKSLQCPVCAGEVMHG